MPKEALDILPVYKLKELSCSVKEINEVSLKSGCLERLYLSLDYHFDTNMQDVIIDLDGIPNLRDLDIIHAGNVKLKITKPLTNLKIIKIRYSTLSDFSWIEWMPNLEKIALVGDKICDIESMYIPASLRYLDLDSNNLTVVKDIEKLKSLHYLSVKRNPNLTNIQQLYKIGIPNFISDQIVVREDDFESHVKEAALWSTRYINKLLNKPEDELSYWERKERKRSYEELFVQKMNYQLKSNYDRMKKSSDIDRSIRFKEYITQYYSYVNTDKWDD